MFSTVIIIVASNDQRHVFYKFTNSFVLLFYLAKDLFPSGAMLRWPILHTESQNVG